MDGKTIVSVRIPDDVLLGIDERVFELRKKKERGRAASRTGVIIELLTQAVLKPGANLGDKP